MPGVRLSERVRTIVEGGARGGVSRLRASVAITACAAICAAFVAVTLMGAQSSATQDWEKAAGGEISFEVASVKQDISGVPPAGYSNFPLFAGSVFPPNGGRVSIKNLPLWYFVVFTYKLGGSEANEIYPQLPKWALTERFDIEARAPEGTTKDQMRMMMRSLLEERFRFAAHWETERQAVYDLVFEKPDKMGPHLRLYSSDEPACPGAPAATPYGTNSKEALATITGGFPAICGGIQPLVASSPEMHRIGSRNIKMSMFASSFTGEATAVDRPIVDETGIEGNIDFILEYYRLGSSQPEMLPGPTFLEAIKDQLGLKLKPDTALVRRLVIDHVEEPTAN